MLLMGGFLLHSPLIVKRSLEHLLLLPLGDCCVLREMERHRLSLGRCPRGLRAEGVPACCAERCGHGKGGVVTLSRLDGMQ